MKKNVIGILACTIIMLCVILILGPLDLFTHGYYCDEIDFDQIIAEDFVDYVRLEDGDFEMKFSPQKNHFAGFEIYLVNQPQDNTGTLTLTVLEETGKVIDSIEVDLGRVPAASWYKVYTNVSLKKGKVYTLRFSAAECADIPYLQAVDSDYLPDETISGNILIGYAYADSTFSFQSKVLFGLFIVAVWGCVCVGFLGNVKAKKCLKVMAVFVFLVAALSWNYMYNSMDDGNTSFSDFQVYSETYVTSVIYADHDSVNFLGSDEQGYGLGRYYNTRGELYDYDHRYMTNENWVEGYSKTQAAIIINSNEYTRTVAIIGNYIGFPNGTVFQITGIEDNGNEIIAYLDSNHILTEAKYGSLSNALFYDDKMQLLAPSLIVAYKSQYGMQGKIFKHMARFMDSEQVVANLNLICCIATAVVFIMIIFLLAWKYNYILSGCFLATFWLSPWIVNFAGNLYWVEFTWFIPMIIGLFCAWKIQIPKCRVISYIAAFVSILAKCLCGYEYVSVIMMGLISFLVVDFAVAVSAKDKQKCRLLLRTIIILGVAAIAAFAMAILVHASLRGNGDVWQGIKDIIKQDVLKRTYGADLNEYDQVYGQSFNASMWEVLCKYFHFTTEIITGIAGNLFPTLCIIPLCILTYEYKKGKNNIEQLSMYVIFFLTSVSWFCLAKSHSYIHRHMNFVLWYFGFVQICFYVIVNKVISVFKGISEHRKGE